MVWQLYYSFMLSYYLLLIIVHHFLFSSVFIVDTIMVFLFTKVFTVMINWTTTTTIIIITANAITRETDVMKLCSLDVSLRHLFLIAILDDLMQLVSRLLASVFHFTFMHFLIYSHITIVSFIDVWVHYRLTTYYHLECTP